jgi:hypothetical protein
LNQNISNKRAITLPTQELEASQLQRQTRKFSIGTFLLFLFWPFGVLINSLFHFRSREAKIVFWLFCIFFGLSFIVDRNIESLADSKSYAAALVAMHNQPFSFDTLISSLYNPQTGVTDIYQPIATWLVAIFTGDTRWLFALFAAVFGYFLTQNLWMVFQRIERKVDFILFIFILYFSIINPIWNINGVRMWTAVHIYFYGILQYFLNKNKKALIWCAVSFLFHFSMLFPIALIGLYLILPSKTNLYFVFFIVSAFLKEINLAQVQQALSFLPEIFQYKVAAYTNENYALMVSQGMENAAWHFKLALLFRTYTFYLWVILVYIKRNSWLQGRPQLKMFFDFSLFFGGFAQIASLMPSGFRFMTIAYLSFFTVFVLLLSVRKRPALMKAFAYISLPLIAFVIIFLVRVGTAYFGVLIFIGNPILNFLIPDQTPLIDIVKQFLG